nr:ThiF family adenylyltransferase [Bacillus thuringiensis]
MGIGHITRGDPDEFETSDIKRQMHSSIRHFGQPKISVALKTLQDITPSLQVKITQEFVTDDDAKGLLTNTNVIIDATDNLVAKIIIHWTAYLQELSTEMKNIIHGLKDRRSLHSAKHGADEKWNDSYVKKIDHGSC